MYVLVQAKLHLRDGAVTDYLPDNLLPGQYPQCLLYGNPNTPLYPSDAFPHSVYSNKKNRYMPVNAQIFSNL